MKKNVNDFIEMKLKNEPIVYLTAYDYLTAKMEEKAGIDMILVGDSLGMVSLGYDTTFPVTMNDMIRHCQAVRRGAPETFIVGDMPFLSYQETDEQAIHNAGRFIKEAGVDAVKLEGGNEVIGKRISAIQNAGILVMGHIGLTPQFMGPLGGYKAQGKKAESAIQLVKQARLLEKAGAFSILVEGVPAVVGKGISQNLTIPVLGIGAGPYVDGQLLIYADMVGLYDNFTPKFVKKYAQVGDILVEAFSNYKKEVKEKAFPEIDRHTYKINEDESINFEKMLKESL